MSRQNRQRRSCPPEQCVEAAILVVSTGRSIAAVTKELDLGEQILGT